MDLNDLRKEIDNIDDKLMEIYIERTKLVKQVADYKLKNNIAILNSGREQNIIKRLIEKFGNEYKQDIYTLYPSIMNISKLRQARENRSIDINSLIEFSHNRYRGNDENLNITVQGVEGSYSMRAAEQMFSGCKISYQKSFADVFEIVSEGKADYGVVPIENSNAGSVNEVYDLLSHYGLYIAKAKQFKIEHCLVGLPNTKKQDIIEVYSHEQALYQCKNFIHKNGYKAISKGNTALAAEEISKQNDYAKAAIASENAAKIYGLEIIERNIQDEDYNYTRFIAISKENVKNSVANKLSLVATLEHKEGALLQLLNIIASYNVNMTKLESRPIPGSSFEFLFYFDIIGNINDEDIQNMLFDIYEYSTSVIFLGGYQEE